MTMNQKSVLKFKQEWSQFLKSGSAHFSYVPRDWDPVKKPDGVPFLMLSSEPMPRSSLTQLDGALKFDKIAQGEVRFDRGGVPVFGIGGASTLKSAASLRGGVKAFGKAAKQGGALEALSALTGIRKLDKPKASTKGGVVEIEGLDTDTELATKGGKSGYVKKQRELDRVDVDLDDGLFEHILVELNRFHRVFEGGIGLADAGKAMAGIKAVYDACGAWGKKHGGSTKKAKKSRALIVSNVQSQCLEALEKVKVEQARWLEMEPYDGSTLPSSILPDEIETATVGDKGGYVKKRTKQAREQAELDAKSTFNAMLAALREWNTAYRKALTRDNVDEAIVALEKIKGMAEDWQKSHGGDTFNAKRKQAVTDFQKQLTTTERAIKRTIEVWKKEDFDASLDDRMADIQDKTRPLEARWKEGDELRKELDERIKAATDEDERAALLGEREELQGALMHVADERENQLSEDWADLEIGLDLLSTVDKSHQEAWLKNATKMLDDTVDVAETLLDNLEEGGGHKQEHVVEQLKGMVDRMLKITDVDGVELAKGDRAARAIEAILHKLEAVDEEDGFSDIEDAFLTHLGDQTGKLISTAATSGNDNWVGSLSRDNTLDSKMRAAFCRAVGTEAGSELLSEMAGEMDKVDKEARRQGAPHPVESLPKDEQPKTNYDEQRTALLAKAWPTAEKMGVDKKLWTEKVSMSAALFPNLQDYTQIDGRRMPTVGKIVALALQEQEKADAEAVKHGKLDAAPDLARKLADEYAGEVEDFILTKPNMDQLTGVVRGLIDRTERVDILAVLRALPTSMISAPDKQHRLQAMQYAEDPEELALIAKGEEQLETHRKEVVKIKEDYEVAHAALISSIASILRKALAPITDVKNIPKIPLAIRQLCEKSVASMTDYGATGDAVYTLCTDILVLRWLNPNITLHGGRDEPGRKPSPGKLQTQVGGLVQNVANGTLPRKVELEPYIPVVKEHQPLFKAFVVELIRQTREDLAKLDVSVEM